MFFLIFRFQDTEEVSGKNNQKNLFSILSLLGVILQRLCSRQVPHVGSIQVAYILGFPTFVRRRRKNSPNLSSPSPNVRRDKISRSGNPLTLILSLRTLGPGLDRFGASFRRRFSKVGKPTKEEVKCGPTWGTCLEQLSLIHI